MTNPLTLIGRWWRQRQRNLDHEILFPAISERAQTTTQLRFAMMTHIELDPAWQHPEEFNQRDRLAWHTAFGEMP